MGIRSAEAMRSLICATLALLFVYSSGTVLFHDDFSECITTVNPGNSQPGTKWTPISKQWGGDISGGVVPLNVKCVQDAGRTVLALEAHGDTFTGTGPIGVKTHGSHGEWLPRDANDEWKTWGYDGYSKTCAPHCDVLRVGAAVQSLETFGDGGTFEVQMKPCAHQGVLAAIWTYNYTEINCNVKDKYSQCTAEYTEKCCESDPCTAENDQCQGTYVSNQEIDLLETPTAGSNGEDIDDPANINHRNTRFSSYTALKPCEHCHCEVNKDTCQGNKFVQHKTKLCEDYHTFRLDWDVHAHTAKYYIDGVHKSTLEGEAVVPNFGSLWLGAWFPNSWAGTPDFDTCQVLVRDVKVSTLAPPGPPTPTPTPTPPPPSPPAPSPAEKCNWETAVVFCSAAADCESWVSLHCHGEGVTTYCSTDKGTCHFSPGVPTPPTPPTPPPPTPPPAPPAPTKAPTNPAPSTCNWRTAAVACTAQSACDQWISDNCPKLIGERLNSYCTYKHFCHFSSTGPLPPSPPPPPTPPVPTPPPPPAPTKAPTTRAPTKAPTTRAPTKAPTNPPAKKCEWATATIACKSDDDCQAWVTKNCKPGQMSQDYCKPNGFCHFSPALVEEVEDAWYQYVGDVPIAQQ